MKHTFVNARFTGLLAAVVFVLFSTAAFAKPADINAKVLSDFASSYANAESVNWKVTKQFFKASFTNKDKRMEVFYNLKGKLIGTAVYVTLKELPAGTASSLADEYPGYRAAEAIQYTDAQQQLNYFISLKKNNKTIVLQVSPQGETTVVKSIYE